VSLIGVTLIETSSLPMPAINACSNDVLFVAFRPAKIVTPGEKDTEDSSMPPIFSTESSMLSVAESGVLVG